MKELHLDIETRSSVDLAKGGAYRYAASPDFEILFLGYSIDGAEALVVDLASGERIPEEILRAIADDGVVKWAHNSSFERVCLSRWLRDNRPDLFHSYSVPDDPVRDYLNPVSWRCTMVLAAYNGLPLSLDKVGAVLGFEEQKLKEGKDLIRFFCVPSRVQGRAWNLPEHAPEKWDLFKVYNKRDVQVEMQIYDRLKKYTVPDSVWEQYHLDQEINDRGIRIDRQLVEQAVRLDELTKASLTDAMRKLTRLANPNSVAQLKAYLTSSGMEVGSLGKKDVAALMKDASPEMAEVLDIRLQLAKSSVKKYAAMLGSACDDGRCRGMFFFYGANRTGRWASRIVQLQNLRKNEMRDLEQARGLVRSGDYEMLSLLYASIPDTLSELVRTAFVPAPGMKFVVADFSAIEARVLAFIAGEQWVLDVFHNGGDIYCETASRMFGVPVEKHGQNAELRTKGKQATLSCGYSGSVGALRAMGALEAGMKEEELQPLVDSWRAANPNIVQFWWDVDTAAKNAIKNHDKQKVGYITFEYRNSMLFAHLPSGRRLSYVKPRIGVNRFGNESITYMGVDGTKHWSRIETFGGKLVENCLAEGTLVLTGRGLVPIERITLDMPVWDGEEWVHHDGLIDRGIQPVISVDGIKMTPEHKILTREGWIEGGKADRSYWANVQLPDSYPSCGEYQAGKSAMDVPLCLWEGSHCPSGAFEGQEVSCKVVRLYATASDLRLPYPTWNEPSSGVRGLAFVEAALSGSESSSVSQLWSQRDNCLRSLAGELRELLGRYGFDMEKRARSGQGRQQCGLQSGELPVDEQKTKLSEQAEYQNDHYPVLDASCIRCVRTDRHQRNNAAVSDGSRLASGIVIQSAKRPERVYDIRNCGPRHRFTVWNGKRFCVVSNCVQAISRDILCHAMRTLSHCRIVGHVHDELIIEASKDVSVDTICEQMGRTPPWLPGIELKADGYECGFYMKQ